MGSILIGGAASLVAGSLHMGFWRGSAVFALTVIGLEMRRTGKQD